MSDAEQLGPVLLGWVRFEGSGWERADFKVDRGRLGVQRDSGALSWVFFSAIRRIDEVSAEVDGWVQIELVLTDSTTVGAKLGAVLLSELITAMATPVAASTPPATAPKQAAQQTAPKSAWEGLASPPSKTPQPAAQRAPTVYKPQGSAAPATAAAASPATRNRTALIAVGVFVAVVLVAVTGVSVLWLTQSGGEHQLRGVYTLFDEEDVSGVLGDCEGTGGYSDFGAGSDVKVRNAEGTIIGSSTLEDASDLDELYQRLLELDDSFTDVADLEDSLSGLEGSVCSLVFDVTVPDSDQYEVVVGAGNRGSQTYSSQDLETDNWLISITLGT